MVENKAINRMSDEVAAATFQTPQSTSSPGFPQWAGGWGVGGVQGVLSLHLVTRQQLFTGVVPGSERARYC